MGVDRRRVESGVLRDGHEQRAAFQGASAPGNCQRKSSRGAGAAPLQGSSLQRQPQPGAIPTLSSYLRDNSDLENGVIPVTRQRDTGISRVEESGGAAAVEPEFLSECSVSFRQACVTPISPPC